MSAKAAATHESQQQPYAHGYDSAPTTRWHAVRTAENQGGFFLPFLRPGMTLLDCGCGSGRLQWGWPNSLHLVR